MALVEHDDMVETFAPDRTDHPFGEGVLPRRARRNHDFLDAHALDAISECPAVDSVTISNHESRRFVEGKSLDDLLCRSLGRWMRGHVEVDDLAAVAAKHQKREQKPKRGGRNGEEVNGDDVLDVVVEERTPSL